MTDGARLLALYTYREIERPLKAVRSNELLYVGSEMGLEITELFTCKCCGKAARWCGEGPHACSTEDDCDHIQCDHCGMHYSLETEEALGAETVAESRALMKATYNAAMSQPLPPPPRPRRTRPRPCWTPAKKCAI